MKKIFTSTLVLLLFIVGTASAQYYYIPTLTPPGNNPGSLNSDGEYPPGSGLPAGWTNIHTGNAATPAWSTTVTLPFTFTFNGTPVNTYKVSTSGVVTFDVGAVTPPSYTNDTLPNASIPDSSICVWGIQGTGSSDNIVHKTFGSAPNRQHWIQFNSYSHPNLQSGWTYWSIVLEETTNKIYIVDQKKACIVGTSNCAGNIAVTIGIQVDTNTAYQVTGSPNIQSLSNNDGTPANNTYFEYFPGTQSAYNVEGVKMGMFNYYSLASGAISLNGTYRNYGTDTVKTMDVNYTVNGGAVTTNSLTGLSMATGDYLSFTHPDAYTPGSIGTYNLQLWTSNINGNADQVPSNDTVNATIYVTQDTVQRVLLCEEFTSSTCGPCASANPGYNALINSFGANEPGGLVASIKYQMNWPNPGNDPMYSSTDGFARRSYYSVTSIPRVAVGGNDYVGSPNSLNSTFINTQLAEPGYFDIDLTPIYNGNKLTIAGSVKSMRANNGNLVLQMALVDNYVTHNVQTNGETEFFDVFRKMIPNSNGDWMGPQTASQVHTVYYNYNLSGSEPYLTPGLADHGIVAFIQDNTTKEVHQAFYAQLQYDATTGVDQAISNIESLNIYPNPVANNATVAVNLLNDENVTVKMINLLGETVFEERVGMRTGLNTYDINGSDLANGVYIITVNTNSSSMSKKVTVNK